MSVAIPSWATRGGIVPLPPLDDGLTRRLLEAAVREQLSDEERDAVVAVCARVDDASAFLREMIERWQFKGAGEQFMARLFGWLAAERDVLWLGDMLRRQKPWTNDVWARIAPRARAMSLLTQVDTPLGWLELLRFRDSTRVDDLYRSSRNLIYRHAHDLGLQPGEEGELAAPELGFVDGGRDMCGLRAVAPDRDSVHLRRDDGRTFAHMPRSASDAEREHWKLLRDAIVEVLTRGAGRLEHAMVTQRRWDHASWRRCWLEHGLLGSLTRRVVWRGFTDFGAFTFFITDERDVVRCDGTPLDLDAVWGFEVAHPTSFVDEDWQTVLVDHEVVQPFEQVRRGGRRVHESLDPLSLIAAERWGWERRARHAGKSRDILVLTTPEHDVRLHIHPGMQVTEAGRIKAHQVLQTILKTEVVDCESRKELAQADWPAHVAFEIEVLRTRASV